MARNKYTLYLDESVSHNNYKNQVFCMAGVIISENNYSKIVDEVNQLKEKIWHDKTNPSTVVIHQKDVNEGQHSKTKNPDFIRFRENRYSKMLYNGLRDIYKNNDLVVVGTCIIDDDLNTYFSNGIKTDKYLIALQLLLENYCHFLCANNGVGNIMYESRNETDNEKMRNRFYSIKLMGSMYINPKTMQNRILSIDFPEKKNNNIGLQIADFAPNYFARKQLNKKSKRFNIDKELRSLRYDGYLNLRDRFGVKVMP